MEIKEKLVYFLEHYSSAFLVGTYPEKEMIFCNQMAKDLYNIDETMQNVSLIKEIFQSNKIQIDQMIATNFQENNYAIFENITTKKADGTPLLVHGKVGFFDLEKKEIFVELTPKKDERLEMTKHMVSRSSRGEAILEFDEYLTIHFCNDKFYALLGCDKGSCRSDYCNQLASAFPAEQREDLCRQIQEGLSDRENFYLEVEIATVTGEKKWLSLELQRRKLDESGDKLICFVLCIDKYVKTEAQLETVNEYFQAMQELSDDVLYRVDVENMTLYHMVKTDAMEFLGKAIPDYLNTFIREKVVHPDDADNYLRYVEEWYAGKREECQVRFAIESQEYQWYSIRGKKIYGENGKVKEVFGKMVNMERERSMEADYSTLNQYFSAMQDLSSDILFHIDLKTKTFYHSDRSLQSFGIPLEMPNFSKFFVEHGFVHPEDVQSFQDFSSHVLIGGATEFQFRLAVGEGVYEWFHVKSKFIYDKQGVPSEIFGKMVSIQLHKDLELRATHDPMTKVLNKVTFEEEVNDILENTVEGEKNAMIFLDLDDFKGVNDSLGHSFGDFLLTTVGKRLKRAIRETDLVGRLGGDEFVVFMKGIGTESSAMVRTNLLLETLQREFSFEGKNKLIRASLGVSIYPEHGKTYKELIEKSDIALYSSKDKGKNVVTLYSPTLEEKKGRFPETIK